MTFFGEQNKTKLNKKQQQKIKSLENTPSIENRPTIPLLLSVSFRTI